MAASEVVHLKPIAREVESYPPLFRRTRGRPKERRIENGGERARGLQRGEQMAGRSGQCSSSAVPSVVMWDTTELLAMKSVIVYPA